MAEVLSNPSALDAFIKRLRLHSQIDDSNAEEIKKLPFVIVRQRQGSMLAREGDRTSQCAILIEGFVQRYRLTVDGSRQILSLYVPGDPIDFDHLFLSIADDNLQVVRDSTIAYVRHNDLKDLISRRPIIFEAITRLLLVDASIFREWTVNVGQRDARTRIAHLLCEISARLQAQDFDFENISLPLTQDQIADATGLTPVHVNRTLKQLSADGCIERRGAQIMLTYARQLREAAGFNDRYLHLNT